MPPVSPSASQERWRSGIVEGGPHRLSYSRRLLLLMQMAPEASRLFCRWRIGRSPPSSSALPGAPREAFSRRQRPALAPSRRHVGQFLRLQHVRLSHSTIQFHAEVLAQRVLGRDRSRSATIRCFFANAASGWAAGCLLQTVEPTIAHLSIAKTASRWCFCLGRAGRAQPPPRLR